MRGARDADWGHVFSDSSYVVKCFSEKRYENWLRDDWKGSNGPIKNQDLWKQLFGLVWDGPRVVTFTWIRGHTADYPNNNRVDRLAQAAALSAG